MIPERLTPGDTIGIIAPSDPILPEITEHLEIGCDVLRSMGFKIKFGHHIYSNTLGFAAAPQEKARDINSMFDSPTVKAIICAQGGETSNATLQWINWTNIRRHPKIFLGISDITVLLNTIYQKTNLVTFHGTDIIWGFGNNIAPFERDEFQRLLIDGQPGTYPANRSRKTLRNGKAKGRLVGGNIGALLKLAGTPYWPDFTNAIFFVEAYEITAKACHSAFYQMGQLGVFDQISGAIVGYIDGMQREGSKGPQMEDILLSVTTEKSFPILKINDFGHNCANTILPIGGEVMMDAAKQDLQLTSRVVK